MPGAAREGIIAIEMPKLAKVMPKSNMVAFAGGVAPLHSPLPRSRLALPPLAHSLRDRA